jgi:hypothetical protein
VVCVILKIELWVLYQYVAYIYRYPYIPNIKGYIICIRVCEEILRALFVKNIVIIASFQYSTI